MTRTGLLTIAALMLGSAPAFADSCLPFLAQYQEQSNGSTALTMTTLNRNALVSYAVFNMSYINAFPLGRRFNSLSQADVVFSDRQKGSQGFDVARPDKLTISVTVAASPQVTLTLNSWNNVKATFTATCTFNGIMHGSTGDVDYLLFFQYIPPIG